MLSHYLIAFGDTVALKIHTSPWIHLSPTLLLSQLWDIDQYISILINTLPLLPALCLLCLFDPITPSMLKEILSQLSDLNHKVYLQHYVVFNGAELILAFDSTLCVCMCLCGWMGGWLSMCLCVLSVYFSWLFALPLW